MYIVQGKIGDPFLWSEMPEDIKIVLIEDFSELFKLETLFNNITGDWYINKRGGRHSFLPFSKSPKLILTSTQPLTSKDPSLTHRIGDFSFLITMAKSTGSKVTSGNYFITNGIQQIGRISGN